MEDLGKVFREFRISKNYSLKEAAGRLARPLSYPALSWASRILLRLVSLKFWTISM